MNVYNWQLCSAIFSASDFFWMGKGKNFGILHAGSEFFTYFELRNVDSMILAHYHANMHFLIRTYSQHPKLVLNIRVLSVYLLL